MTKKNWGAGASAVFLKIEIIGSIKQAGLSGNMAKALTEGVILGDNVRPQGSYSSGTMYVPNVLISQGLRVNSA